MPTITSEAIAALVMISMMMKIRHRAATPAMSRSYFDPSTSSLVAAAVPARKTVAFSSGVPLSASVAASCIGSTREIPVGVAGSTFWVMRKRAALPSGDMKIFLICWKAAL